jgi:hypothetical protein
MKIYQFVIPAEAGIYVFHSGFPFSRLRAEALQRAGTGMTEWGLKPDTNHGHGHVYTHGNPGMALRSLSSGVVNDSLGQR